MTVHREDLSHHILTLFLGIRVYVILIAFYRMCVIQSIQIRFIIVDPA